MTEIAKWNVFEMAYESTREWDDPFWDVSMRVQFTAPSGREHVVDAFWDSGSTWRVRFCPDEVGTWRWATASSDPGDEGLHAREGTFKCVPYLGQNRLYRHGPLRVSDSRRHLTYSDGERFFWLGDTAWNGVIRAREEDWQTYLETRRKQTFNVIQFVSTQWRGWQPPSEGEGAFVGTDHIQVNADFFRRLDPKVAAINENGLVAAPVILWTLTEDDPGQTLSEESAIRLAKYIVARWNAYHVVWFLGGDGVYPKERVDRWRRIGRSVFGEDHDRLVTMHPCGTSWVRDEFGGEPWFDFIGYQSGHNASEKALRWHTVGPPADDWLEEPAYPIINLEPNYEAHPAAQGGDIVYTAYEVRRASYWSLLVSPPAGVTFGHNSIWVWPDEEEVPEGHERIGPVGPWENGLDTPGIRSLVILKKFFRSLPWWRLRPAKGLIVSPPGVRDPHSFVAAASTEDGTLAVVYMPLGGEIEVNTTMLKRDVAASWFNPRTGHRKRLGRRPHGVHKFEAPSDEDWVLVIKSES